MRLSAGLTSQQQKEIIEDKKNTDSSARQAQEQVEDGEEVQESQNPSSVLNTGLNTIINEFEPEFLDAAVRLLNAHLNLQSTDDCVPGQKCSIPGLLRTHCLAHQVCATWFFFRRCDWNGDMPGALVVDGRVLERRSPWIQQQCFANW
jgi:hypothetical protein